MSLVPVAVLAALALAGTLYQVIGATRQARRLPPPGQLIDVGGHRLHVRCMGTGSPPVLLESAIAGSSLSWTVVQPEIAKFTRVCAYDRAGLAWSDAPAQPGTFERLVSELTAVVSSMTSGERCVLVGHSFGSFLVRAFAARHPDRVAGLVLVDPAVEWLTLTPESARLLWGGRQLARIGVVLAHLGVVRACLALLTGGRPGAPRRFVKVFGPTAARTLERLVGEVRKLPPEVHPIVQAHWCNPKGFRAIGAHLSALAHGVPPAAIRSSPTIPTVVISSRDQPPQQLTAHRQLAGESTEGRHLIATRSAHWVQFDEPGLVVEAVRELVYKAQGAVRRTQGTEHGAQG